MVCFNFVTVIINKTSKICFSVIFIGISMSKTIKMAVSFEEFLNENTDDYDVKSFKEYNKDRLEKILKNEEKSEDTDNENFEKLQKLFNECINGM